MSHALRLHDGTGEIAVDPSAGVLLAYGTTVPSDGALGYAPGCMFHQTDGTTESTYLYVNTGTKASCNFDAVNLGTAARIVNCTASSLALTVADHDGKTVTLNRAAGVAVTLPDSTAAATLGAKFRLFVGTTVTTTSTITITRDGSATFFGQIFQLADGGATLAAYELPGSTVITLGTDSNTTGGTKGDTIELECVASGVWHVIGYTTAAGTEATPVT